MWSRRVYGWAGNSVGNYHVWKTILERFRRNCLAVGFGSLSVTAYKTAADFMQQSIVTTFLKLVHTCHFFLKVSFLIIFIFCSRVVMTWIRSLTIIENKYRKSERVRYERQLDMNFSKEMVPRWEKDYVLNPLCDQYLFDEYLEMGKSHNSFSNIFIPLAIAFWIVVGEIFELPSR